jgi:hypothetical protein
MVEGATMWDPRGSSMIDPNAATMPPREAQQRNPLLETAVMLDAPPRPAMGGRGSTQSQPPGQSPFAASLGAGQSARPPRALEATLPMNDAPRVAMDPRAAADARAAAIADPVVVPRSRGPLVVLLVLAAFLVLSAIAFAVVFFVLRR